MIAKKARKQGFLVTKTSSALSNPSSLHCGSLWESLRTTILYGINYRHHGLSQGGRNQTMLCKEKEANNQLRLLQ
jgi:hypothetical protein